MGKEQRRASGRPRAFDTDSVLDAATNLFRRKGYRATTTRDLEAELGLSQSSMYNAFGCKKQLLGAVLVRYYQGFESEVLEPIERGTRGLDDLEALLESLAGWALRDGHRGCLLLNLAMEQHDGVEVIDEQAQRYHRRLRHVASETLNRAAQLQELTSGEHERRVDLFVTAVLGINAAARGRLPEPALSQMLLSVKHQVHRWRAPAQQA